MTLAEFLLARIAEDEALARIVWADAREVMGDYSPASEGWRLSGTKQWSGVVVITISRVLAECEAKRQIIAMYQGCVTAEAHSKANADAAPYSDDPTSPFMAATLAWTLVGGGKAAAEGALKCLAAVYADHPDYDPAWAVT